ncbi:MAG: tetratricopeptide repeat protein [Bacteroidota bacterium]
MKSDIDLYIEHIEKEGKINFITRHVIPQHLTILPAIDPGQVVGREHDLQKVLNMLEKTNKLTLVNGLGGIGKTTLAKALLQTHKYKFQYIAWINVVSDIKESFAYNVYLTNSLGLNLEEIPTVKNFTDIVFQIVINRLRNIKGNNLIIIDNAQKDLADQKIKDLIQLGNNWKVLLTSRQQIEGFEIYHLGFLPQEDAKALFYLHYHLEKDDHMVEQMIKSMDYHTLAIEVTAKTAQAKELSLLQLFNALVKKGLQFSEDTSIKLDHNKREKIHSILGYFYSVFELTNLSQDEIWLLAQFSVLPASPIPYQDNQLENIQEFLKLSARPERDQLTNVLNNLVAQGWLQHDEEADSFKMHQLIQEVLRNRLKPDYEYCQSLVDSIIDNTAIPSPGGNPVPKLRFLEYGKSLLRNIPDQRPPLAILNSRIGVLMWHAGQFKHAVSYFDQAIKMGELLKMDSVDIYSNNLALVYEELGDYNQAIELIKHSISKAQQKQVGKNIEIAVRMSNLANIYKQKGEYQQAVNLFYEALTIDIELLGENHLHTAHVQSNLGLIYWELGNLVEAQSFLEKALATMELQLETKHPSLSIVNNNLALVYQDLGMLLKAKEKMEKALASDIQNFGKEHPETINKRSNLAGIIRDLGNHDQAKRIYQENLTSLIKIFGYAHLKVANTLSNLGLLIEMKGDLPNALKRLEEAIELSKKLLGENHSSVLTHMGNLAFVYKKNGKYTKAKKLTEKVIEKSVEQFGENYIPLGKLYSNLAMIHRELGDYITAIQMMNKSIKILTLHFTGSHPEILIKLSNLALLYTDIGKFEEAKQLYGHIIPIEKQQLGEEHPTIAKRFINTALVEMKLNNYKESISLLEAGLSILHKHYDDLHPLKLTALSNLGTIFMEIKKYSTAKKMFEKVLTGMLTIYDADHPKIGMLQMNLGRVYFHLGKTSKSKKILTEALKNLTECFGDNHHIVESIREDLEFITLRRKR